ncbi:uncharacterized protein LOC117118118 [Anneissia japonica]|uniref:uncharacterized protein LOC117118118 n=1 Tax=Anneissia japonica TaxID=1529436 RepID=UPI0014255891|nr:uncharacterized protein LOC117118118 [Anneissia japonica]
MDLNLQCMANSLNNKKYDKFWKSVKRTNAHKSYTSEVINGVRGNVNICNIWADHYEHLFNCVTSTDQKQHVNDKLNYINDHYKDNHITPQIIQNFISKLSLGKSPGLDGIDSEHLKYAGGKINVLLSFCFNALLVHGYIVNDFVEVVLIPIVKNKLGDVTSTNNYRPIALASVLSKLFELILVDFCKDNLETDYHQFAFKPNPSTETCVFVLKQIIEYYQRHGSPVYTCFLDSSKSF